MGGPAAPIIIGIAGLLLSGYSIYQSKEAADEARDRAEAQAAREEEQAEMIAQKERANLEREMALNRARTAASGVKAEGTPEIYMQEYKEERLDDIAWIRRSGAAAAEIARLTGQSARRVGYARTASTAAQSMFRAYDWFSTYMPSSSDSPSYSSNYVPPGSGYTPSK